MLIIEILKVFWIIWNFAQIDQLSIFSSQLQNDKLELSLLMTHLLLALLPPSSGSPLNLTANNKFLVSTLDVGWRGPPK